MALARAILCFWPPLTFFPSGPSPYKSFFSNVFKSLINSHATKHFLYHYLLNSLPNSIFSLIVKFYNQEFWATYATDPLINTFSIAVIVYNRCAENAIESLLIKDQLIQILQFSDLLSNSFKMAFNNAVLPDPILPMTQFRELYFKLNSSIFRTNFSTFFSS